MSKLCGTCTEFCSERVRCDQTGDTRYENSDACADHVQWRPAVPERKARASVLDKAKTLVHGDRNKDYGHPRDDFTRTGRIWGAILGIPDVTPEKVALCMIGVKQSRLCNTPGHLDSITDIAGYAETAGMCLEEEK